MTKSLCAITCAFLLAGGTLSNAVNAESRSSFLQLSQSGTSSNPATDPRTGTGGAGAASGGSSYGSGTTNTRGDESMPQEVDNTGRNERDASGANPTSGSQSENDADIELTRKIRTVLTDDDSLSTNAQNIKIITQDGKVTLRGPVASQQERDKVLSAARKVAGPDKIEDQLEVSGRQGR